MSGCKTCKPHTVEVTASGCSASGVNQLLEELQMIARQHLLSIVTWYPIRLVTRQIAEHCKDAQNGDEHLRSNSKHHTILCPSSVQDPLGWYIREVYVNCSSL